MMKAYLAITLLMFSVLVQADSQTERALQLNEEMDYLMSVAGKAKVWAHGNLPPRSRRSGPAPSQMEGIENVEDQYFSDEVTFKAARAEAPSKKAQSEQDEEESYRVDGTLPQSN